jgi:hypothetical protein
VALIGPLLNPDFAERVKKLSQYLIDESEVDG